MNWFKCATVDNFIKLYNNSFPFLEKNQTQVKKGLFAILTFITTLTKH